MAARARFTSSLRTLGWSPWVVGQFGFDPSRKAFNCQAEDVLLARARISTDLHHDFHHRAIDDKGTGHVPIGGARHRIAAKEGVQLHCGVPGKVFVFTLASQGRF